MRFERITVDPKRMDGVPCIRGLRIPVATVVGMIADGMSEKEILDAYPDLEAADIREALHFAAEAVREPEESFRHAADHILHKNAELYRRLSDAEIDATLRK